MREESLRMVARWGGGEGETRENPPSLTSVDEKNKSFLINIDSELKSIFSFSALCECNTFYTLHIPRIPILPMPFIESVIPKCNSLYTITAHSQ